MLSEKPWRVEGVLLFGAALMFCFCLAALAGGILQQMGVRGFRPSDDVGPVVLGTLGLHGAACLLIPLFLRRHQVDWRDAFGLRGPALKRACLLALLTAIVIIPVAVLLLGVSDRVLTRHGEAPTVQVAIKVIENTRSVWLQVYLGLFAVAVAPVAEEFIFRGVLYPLIKRLGFPRLAWIGVSLLFALIHLAAITFVPLFVLALALTWLYEKTDNLLAPITAHALFNAVNLLHLFLSKPDLLPKSV